MDVAATATEKLSESGKRLLYGYCLNLSGITDADKLLDILLDRNKNLYFTHYVPVNWFNIFASDFVDYAKQQIEFYNWQVDINKIKKPTRKKPIWKHYEEDFSPAF